jgi:hypothetical protein
MSDRQPIVPDLASELVAARARIATLEALRDDLLAQLGICRAQRLVAIAALEEVALLNEKANEIVRKSRTRSR